MIFRGFRDYFFVVLHYMPAVAKNTFYLTMALIGQKILSFLYFTLLARFLGVEAIGQYTFALAFSTIFSTIADLGLTPVLIREIARAKEKMNDYAKTAIIIKSGLALFAYFLLILFACILGYPKLILQLVIFSGLVMVLDSFHLIFYGALRGLHILKYESVGMVVGQGITLLLGSLALFFRLPLYLFILALAAGSFFNVIFSFRIIRRFNISFRPRWNFKIIGFLTRSSIPFALAGIFTKVYSYIDTVLLKHLKGDIEVGWYSVPYKITYAFQFLPLALSAALYPALASAWQKTKEDVQWFFDRALVYSVLLSLPIVFGIAVLAPEIILSIYRQEFFNSIAPLKISIFGLVFIFLYFPVGAFLNASNHQTANTVFMATAMIGNILMNLVLIPRYGAVGASLSAVTTNFILFLLAFLWSLKFIRPSKIVALTFLKALISVLGMSLVVWQSKNMIPWPLTIVLGAFVYIALLLLFRALKIRDLQMLWQKLHSPTNE